MRPDWLKSDNSDNAFSQSVKFKIYFSTLLTNLLAPIKCKVYCHVWKAV